MPHRPLRVTTGRHPFQVGIVAAVPVVAASVAAANPRPAIVAALPDVLEQSWIGMLILGGLGALVGAYWRGDLATALIIEGAALTMLAAMLTWYLVLVVVTFGGAALVGGGLITGMTVAAWARAVQVGMDLRRLNHAKRTGNTTRITVLAEGGAPDASQ